jgi:TolB-like protein/Tfp pilus assembly protein PilF
VPSPAGAVFISYASQDAAVAVALVESLEKRGVACWIAPRDVKAGALYADAIVRAISGARAFVLVLSASAIESSHVGKEVERASSKKRPILALRIDAAPLTPALEYFLSESQWVEAKAGNMEAAYARLIEAMREPERLAPGNTFAVTSGMAAGAAAAAHSQSRRNQILLSAGLIVFAIALAALLADKFWLSKHSTPEQAGVPAASGPPAGKNVATTISEKSIAVLPFTDMSEKHDQEYFSDGLSEDLIDLLTKVPDLHVPARASSFYFKGQHATIAEIAKALSVAYVLEGTVRKAGATIRVRTELIRADNGYNVWSETYDRDLKDIFKVQDEIAGRVVTALRTALPAVKSGDADRTDNTEAYNQYLLGRNFMRPWTEAGWRHAVEAFGKAIALDPHYAGAYAELGEAEAQLADKVGDPAGFTRAMAAVERAIALAPDAANGYVIRGFLRTDFLWDWDGAGKDFDKALSLDPNVALERYASILAQAQGRLTDAIAMQSRATQRDPLVPIVWEYLSNLLVDAGRRPEARAAIAHSLEIDPDFSLGHLDLALLELGDGRLDQALAQTREVHDRGWQLLGAAVVQYSLKHPQESQQALDELIKTEAADEAYQIAQIYAWRGEKDQAFMWLDRAYAQRDGGLIQVKTDWLLGSLRSDPRYGALLRKMKLPE